MSDMLGPIAIPDPPIIGAFPLLGDFGSGTDYTPPIAAHVFDQPGLKTEQRYLLGAGARRFKVVRTRGLACNEYDNLKAHWIQAQGGYAQFPYTHNAPDQSFTVTARYENPNVQFDHLIAMLWNDPGITLLEVPQTTPSYTSVKTVSRFPDGTLNTALTAQVQQFIPLIQIAPRDDGTHPTPIYLSNQRCTVDNQLYLPRVLDWGGISQTLSDTSDSATFTLGNADDVLTQYANQVNLFRARIQFSLYHVNTNYRIDLWVGYARAWNMTSDGRFILPTSDGLFEMGLAYPSRPLARTCWKVYKGRFCPSTSSFPDCPKDYNSCVARGVPKSFGGVQANPQTVHILDNSTGIVGWGRSMLTSVSVASDTIYQRPVQEVYTDENMLVNCDVAEGRDESEYYSALGIVGEGPIGGYSPNLILHSLDGQPPQDPQRNMGWRGIVGNDPANDLDYFGLDQAPWTSVPPDATYAAGLAFAEIRRTDAKGLQLSPVSDRKMQVTVAQGISGWTWTAPGARVYTAGLSNCVWVAVNVYLRAIGLRVGPANAADVPPEVMEQYVDIPQAIAAAGICDKPVDKLVGTGQERQYPFRGVIKEQKPLKDWLQEILNCCLGYYTFSNGKLWIGVRENSGVLTGNAFSPATTLYQSLQATPVAPAFNWLVGEFGDEEFYWQLNTVTVYDIDAAGFNGSADSPRYTQNTMSFVGVSNKSQCARLITTRLREELGGVGLAEQADSRHLQFKTTLLAMQTQVGDIISHSSPRLPNAYCEGRVQKWTLNPDFSIDITASATTDSMYDLVFGPKPVDVPAQAVPPEVLQSPDGLAWMPFHLGPFAGDPLYPDMRERTFDLTQEYAITREGVWSPTLLISGDMVVNRFVQPVQPRIVGVSLVSGGSLAGPMAIYVAVTQHDASGLYTVPSNLAAVWIPAGATGQALSISLAAAPTGPWTGWDLYAGSDRRRIALQSSTEAALPATTTLNGPIAPMTMELPEAAARRVRIAVKHVWHSGVAGVLVNSVPAANQVQSDELVGSMDNWVGRIVSAVADASDGSAPLWNFRVTGFDGSTGTLTVTPNVTQGTLQDSVQAGDPLAIRSIATAAGSNYIEDSLWNNFIANTEFGSPGLDPGAETGRLVRILRGTGAGQLRRITDNTNTRIYVEPDWDVIPDNTSIAIVEAADYDYFSETSDIDAPRSGKPFELKIRVDNLANEVALVVGFLVDDQGQITDEEFTVQREIYIFGEPPGVRQVGPGAGPYEMELEDQTIRADTSANDVTITLLPIAEYAGRTLYVANDNGPHNVIVQCADGEYLFDGNTSVTLAPQETVRVTSG